MGGARLQRIDEAGGWVYFSGTRDGWLGSNLYRVKLDGSAMERLTKRSGTHSVNVSPGGKYFIDNWSNYQTPPQVCLCGSDGAVVRMIDSGAVNKLAEEYDLGKHQFREIKMPDGYVLDASVMLPPSFDAKKKYPVWFMTYAGPQMPTLHDRWSGGGTADQALATMGYIIFRFDPRSASGKGAVSAWTAYRQLGVQELKDIEAALKWLIDTYPGVDAKRIGMSGHSYGGYITSYALTHSTMFAAGIAGSPVTDWRNYDSIYTERYMGLPQDNPKGYEVSSVVKGAKNLHGKLLLIHGMMDDNVHVQNTIQLMDALQKANREFEVMLYPHARHGIGGNHYRRLENEFMKRACSRKTNHRDTETQRKTMKKPACLGLLFFVFSLCLCVSVVDCSQAELPKRTTLSDPTIRYEVPKKPYAVLHRAGIEAVIVNNEAVNDAVLPKHRAGYSGVASLMGAGLKTNYFVPTVAGLNFEHIHDGTTQKDKTIQYEPRHAPMELRSHQRAYRRVVPGCHAALRAGELFALSDVGGRRDRNDAGMYPAQADLQERLHRPVLGQLHQSTGIA